jgi:IS5 family transposase
VFERWVENPYWQVFCGFDHLQLRLSVDPSSLVRWRPWIGQDGIERLLQETIAAATCGQSVKQQSLEWVSVDTTVEPKAIAHLSHSRLITAAARSGSAWPSVMACRCARATPGSARRRCGSPAANAHDRQMKRARREIKRLKTYLGRVWRDVRRKLADRPEVAEHFRRAVRPR